MNRVMVISTIPSNLVMESRSPRVPWIIAEAHEVGLTEVYFRAQGWDNHQDVFAFVRPSSA
jgi:hypothetical protein